MKCPQCGSECCRDEVDNGVGMQPAGPWYCDNCHWVDPEDYMDFLRPEEPKP